MTRRRSRWATCRPLLAHRAESAHQRPGKQLRDKLADEADRPALIVNERGVGYRMPRPGDP